MLSRCHALQCGCNRWWVVKMCCGVQCMLVGVWCLWDLQVCFVFRTWKCCWCPTRPMLLRLHTMSLLRRENRLLREHNSWTSEFWTQEHACAQRRTNDSASRIQCVFECYDVIRFRADLVGRVWGEFLEERHVDFYTCWHSKFHDLETFLEWICSSGVICRRLYKRLFVLL